jgi:soluble lytic murein transglycosylase-like protein
MSPVVAVLVVAGLTAAGVLAFRRKSYAETLEGSSAEAAGGRWPYYDLVVKYAEKYGVEPALVAAHARVESGWDPLSENLEDPSLDYDSSYGLMQVQLATAQDFGKVKNYRSATPAEISWLMYPEHNIQVGAWNIARWQKKYSFDVAVQMYNVGESGYNKYGYRNSKYLARVKEAYNEYRAG